MKKFVSAFLFGKKITKKKPVIGQSKDAPDYFQSLSELKPLDFKESPVALGKPGDSAVLPGRLFNFSQSFKHAKITFATKTESISTAIAVLTSTKVYSQGIHYPCSCNGPHHSLIVAKFAKAVARQMLKNKATKAKIMREIDSLHPDAQVFLSRNNYKNFFKIIELMALLHDSGRPSDGEDKWDRSNIINTQVNMRVFLETTSLSEGAIDSIMREVTSGITYKDDKDKDDEEGFLFGAALGAGDVLHSGHAFHGGVWDGLKFDPNYVRVYVQYPEFRPDFDAIVKEVGKFIKPPTEENGGKLAAVRHYLVNPTHNDGGPSIIKSSYAAIIENEFNRLDPSAFPLLSKAFSLESEAKESPDPEVKVAEGVLPKATKVARLGIQRLLNKGWFENEEKVGDSHLIYFKDEAAAQAAHAALSSLFKGTQHQDFSSSGIISSSPTPYIMIKTQEKEFAESLGIKFKKDKPLIWTLVPESTVSESEQSEFSDRPLDSKESPVAPSSGAAPVMKIEQLLDKIKKLPKQKLTGEIKENIAKLKEICDHEFYDQNYYGNAALNRQMLLSPEIIALLTPAVLKYLFTNDPDENSQIKRNSGGPTTLRDAIFYGLKDGLHIIKFMPNNEKDYGLKAYKQQKLNFETHTLQLVRNLKIAVGELEDAKVIVEDLFQHSLQDQFNLVVDTINQIKKAGKSSELLSVPSYKPDQIRAQVNAGFRRACDLLEISYSKDPIILQNVTIDDFCECYLKNPAVLLNGEVAHHFFDRAHLEAALEQDTVITIGDIEYTYVDFFRVMVEKIVTAPEAYPDCAAEQFHLRFELVVSHLHSKFSQYIQKESTKETEVKEVKEKEKEKETKQKDSKDESKTIPAPTVTGQSKEAEEGENSAPQGDSEEPDEKLSIAPITEDAGKWLKRQHLLQYENAAGGLDKLIKKVLESNAEQKIKSSDELVSLLKRGDLAGFDAEIQKLHLTQNLYGKLYARLVPRLYCDQSLTGANGLPVDGIGDVIESMKFQCQSADKQYRKIAGSSWTKNCERLDQLNKYLNSALKHPKDGPECVKNMRVFTHRIIGIAFLLKFGTVPGYKENHWFKGNASGYGDDSLRMIYAKQFGFSEPDVRSHSIPEIVVRLQRHCIQGMLTQPTNGVVNEDGENLLEVLESESKTLSSNYSGLVNYCRDEKITQKENSQCFNYVFEKRCNSIFAQKTVAQAYLGFGGAFAGSVASKRASLSKIELKTDVSNRREPDVELSKKQLQFLLDVFNTAVSHAKPITIQNPYIEDFISKLRKIVNSEARVSIKVSEVRDQLIDLVNTRGDFCNGFFGLESGNGKARADLVMHLRNQVLAFRKEELVVGPLGNFAARLKLGMDKCKGVVQEQEQELSTNTNSSKSEKI